MEKPTDTVSISDIVSKVSKEIRNDPYASTEDVVSIIKNEIDLAFINCENSDSIDVRGLYDQVFRQMFAVVKSEA